MTLLILPFLSSAQSGVIKGVILNENSVPMAGEVVVLNGTNYQSITDKDGAFTMSGVTYGTYSLSVQDVAYNGFKQEVVVNAESVDVGSVKLVYSPGTTTTEADIPVVTLDDDELQSNSAQSSVSSVLGASRDAFTSAANFNFSVARFKTRGYDTENFPTLMNGIAEEDLTNGRTAFSSWSGLNDVLRSRESTSGLNPSTYAFGGVGGSYSIDSRAGRQRKQIQATYSLSNRTYDNRFMLTYGSGFNKKGWAYSASISKRWAKEGFIKGTYYDGFAYYLGVSKVINKHEFDFTVLGSQYESARSSSNTKEVYDIASDHYYNSNWGYQNGEIRNANIGRSHQPVFTLNHEYKISNNTTWFSALSYTTGKRESTALNWFAADPRPTYYRNLPSWQTDSAAAAQVYNTLKANPDLLQINWDNMLLANDQNFQTVNNADGVAGSTVSGKQALYLIENRVMQTN
ncbi:MAG TPA: carboxypeptidase-like regulatory domain-containing protein, partial [Bacteroidia bacterium]|nr:carboxypeptidase-like regulatory domain-containing protein [Bacteroidia bacterium]